MFSVALARISKRPFRMEEHEEYNFSMTHKTVDCLCRKDPRTNITRRRDLYGDLLEIQ